MIITSILASPHGIKGNTSVLASWLLLEAEKAGARICGISLRDRNIGQCIGCDNCLENKECSLDDDFSFISNVVAESDGIVLISPLHFFICSSYMKVFIDRCRGLLKHELWKGKYAAVVMTSLINDPQNAVDYLSDFLQAAGCQMVGSVHARVSFWQDENNMKNSFNEARELGRRMVSAICNKHTHEKQRPVSDTFHEPLQCMRLLPSFSKHSRIASWPDPKKERQH